MEQLNFDCKKCLWLLLFMVGAVFLNAQTHQFTAEDTLRGANNPARSWWDLTYYDLYVSVYPEEKRIEGRNVIRYQVKEPHQVLQIDLQDPLQIIKITQDGHELGFEKKYSSYLVSLKKVQEIGKTEEIVVNYGGHPTESIRPPWSGGITWDKDKSGKWFIANSNQTAGASIWWPCKDHPADEVDSMLISVNIPAGLQDVSNGRLRSITDEPDGRRTFHWFVANPINSYGVNINIADYTHFSEIFQGEKGPLTCDYYVLPYNLDKAKNQFQQATKMLEAFEYWLGPYPFYEDGYKLVEAPYLGMEHQSSVTYGNHFENGYLGRDLSHTGWGMKFDFIIIHESAHEWFANSITYADLADMWIHESFTNYCESLYVEYYYGKEAGAEYVRGMRANTENNCPMQGVYGVDDEGCGGADMYYKGSNMWHMLRQIVNDDDHWRELLRGVNKTFYHQTVLAADIEGYMDAHIDVGLRSFFDQYVRDARIPVFSYWMDNGKMKYRYDNTVDGFTMPLRIWVNGEPRWLMDASDEWHSLDLPDDVKPDDIKMDVDFYVAAFDLGVKQIDE